MNKALQIKIAHRLIKGLIVGWTDAAPLTDSKDITQEIISHKSPVLRLNAKQIWRDYKAWIIERPTLLWLIDIDIVYREEDGDRLDQLRIIKRNRLADIADACYPKIVAVMEDEDNKGKTPLETRFKVQCLGDRPATEADYGDYEAA